MRRTPRKRRYVSPRTIRVLRQLGFRYDTRRQAWVLVGIGRWVGPVFKAGAAAASDR